MFKARYRAGVLECEAAVAQDAPDVAFEYQTCFKNSGKSGLFLSGMPSHNNERTGGTAMHDFGMTFARYMYVFAAGSAACCGETVEAKELEPCIQQVVHELITDKPERIIAVSRSCQVIMHALASTMNVAAKKPKEVIMIAPEMHEGDIDKLLECMGHRMLSDKTTFHIHMSKEAEDDPNSSALTTPKFLGATRSLNNVNVFLYSFQDQDTGRNCKMDHNNVQLTAKKLLSDHPDDKLGEHTVVSGVKYYDGGDFVEYSSQVTKYSGL